MSHQRRDSIVTKVSKWTKVRLETMDKLEDTSGSSSLLDLQAGVDALLKAQLAAATLEAQDAVIDAKRDMDAENDAQDREASVKADIDQQVADIVVPVVIAAEVANRVADALDTIAAAAPAVEADDEEDDDNEDDEAADDDTGAPETAPETVSVDDASAIVPEQSASVDTENPPLQRMENVTQDQVDIQVPVPVATDEKN